MHDPTRRAQCTLPVPRTESPAWPRPGSNVACGNGRAAAPRVQYPWVRLPVLIISLCLFVIAKCVCLCLVQVEDRFFRLEDMERYVADAERRAARGSDDDDDEGGGLGLGDEDEEDEDEEDDELLMQGGAMGGWDRLVAMAGQRRWRETGVCVAAFAASGAQ